LQRRANKVAIAAIFYGDLKNNRINNMIFDIDRFVSFEGDTGPYLLYSYARASSILEKAKKQKLKKSEFEDFEESESRLLKKISDFKDIVLKAYSTLSPSVIANYSYELSQIFNEFYSECPVIGSEKEEFRLKLVDAFRQVLKNSLYLIGIDVLERM